MGSRYYFAMRVIAKRTLRKFWAEHADSEQPLKAWHDEMLKASWSRPSDIKAMYRNASFVANNRVVFNIAGNKYRLVAAIDYRRQALFIKFIGTHTEYDKVNVEQV
jgi:mRNA interferase HigB